MEPNVLLVVLDAVRARNTSLHGHDNATTPFLEQFADEATVYTQARAPSTHSIASHASIWTGLPVPEHGATRLDSRLDPAATVWHDLEQQGYQTGLFTQNPVISKSSNLGEAFGTVDTPDFEAGNERLFDAFDPTDVDAHEGVRGNFKRAIRSDRPLRALANCAWRASRGDQVPAYKRETGAASVEDFLTWEQATDGPWAACINVIDAHAPYLPADEYDEWAGQRVRAVYDETGTIKHQFVAADRRPWGELRAIEAIYDGCLRQADAVVEQLVGRLRERGALDETLLVITSDHGEGFGERSPVTPACRAVSHAWGVHEVLTHVPLVVSYPGQDEHREVPAAASLTRFADCVDQIREEPAAPADDPFTGDPVLTMTERLRPDEQAAFDHPEIDAYGGPWQARYETTDDSVRKDITRGDPVVDDGTVLVYNAQTSRLVDSADTRERVDDAYAALESAAATETGEMAAETKKQLQDLGYL